MHRMIIISINAINRKENYGEMQRSGTKTINKSEIESHQEKFSSSSLDQSIYLHHSILS